MISALYVPETEVRASTPTHTNAARSDASLRRFSHDSENSHGSLSAEGYGPHALISEQDKSIIFAGDDLGNMHVRSMMVGTVDGLVHAVNPATGELIWSFSTGETLVKSYQQLPGSLDAKRWLVPALDGTMLMHTSHGLRNLGINARDLAELTPLLAGSSTFYTGARISHLYRLDANSGKLLQTLSGNGADSISVHQKHADNGSESNGIIFPKAASNEDVWIARVDHIVRAFDVPTGIEQWNLTVGEFVCTDGMNPGLSEDSPWNSLLRLPRSIGTPNGTLHFVDSEYPSLDGIDVNTLDWSTSFEAPVAAVFAVLEQKGNDELNYPVHRLPLHHVSHGDEHWENGGSNTAALGVLPGGQVYAMMLSGEDSYEFETSGSNPARRPVKNSHGLITAGEGTVGREGGRPRPGLSHIGSSGPGRTGGGSQYPPGGEQGTKCAVGHPSFPNCLRGVYPILSEESIRSQSGDIYPFGKGSFPRLPLPENRGLHEGKLVISLGTSGSHESIIFPSTQYNWKLFSLVITLAMTFTAIYSSLKSTKRAAEFSNEIRTTRQGDKVPVRDEEGYLNVGVLRVSDTVLGYGSSGTVVYRGLLAGRAVAVKRMLKDFHAKADREISLLIESDGHPHVVRYFLREECGEFVYLALQLCELSLHNSITQIQQESQKERSFTEAKILVSAPVELRNALLEIAEGVRHLHSLRIVHRDLKPHNILLASKATERGTTIPDMQVSISAISDLSDFVLKISDMGLGKQLAIGQSSYEQSTSHHIRPGTSNSRAGTGGGTTGWQAPEVLTRRIQGLNDSDDNASDPGKGHYRAQSSDVFALGCVFHYCLDLGGHPFGEWYEREVNVLRGEPRHLDRLSSIPDAYDLVSGMISADPTQRPTATDVCRHPFFWGDEKRLAFLVDFSDRLEREEGASSALLLRVERGAEAVVGRSWDRRLDAALLEDAGKYRSYDRASARDLLRLVRNKRHHFHELPTQARALLAPLPSGLLRYVEGLFPKLIMHCYNSAKDILRGDPVFKEYLPPEILILEDLSISSKIIEIGSTSPSSPVESEPLVSDGTNVIENLLEAPPLSLIEDSLTVEVEGEIDIKNEEMNSDGGDEPPQVSGMVVWSGGILAKELGCRGWWRHGDDWGKKPEGGKGRGQLPAHLARAASDPKYRTRLCSHWDTSQGQMCPMRRKGRCDFAHSAMELRVRPAKRDRWGTRIENPLTSSNRDPNSFSGGQDTLGAARGVEVMRANAPQDGPGRVRAGGKGGYGGVSRPAKEKPAPRNIGGMLNDQAPIYVPSVYTTGAY